MMNIELKLLLAITRNLPKVRGAGWIANMLKAFYNRKPRPNEVASFQGLKFDLETNECVDGGILFYPQLYDWQEIAFIKKNLPRNGKFVDAGANIGWYSLIASKIVGSKGGAVIAIEMDSYNARKLTQNIFLNNVDNVHVIQAGLSDCDEELNIRENLTGNRGGNSLVDANKDGAAVMCHPLLSILVECGWDRIDGMKIDIEGMELRVLNAFFKHAPRGLHPRFVIAEINPGYNKNGAAELHNLFLKHGYREDQRMGLNSIYCLEGINGK